MDLYKKILVPYFLAGGGHIIAAESITHYLNLKRPEWDIRFLEPADEFEDKKLDRFFRRSWQLLLQKPNLAKFVYSFFANTFPSTTIAANKTAIKGAVPKAIGYLLGYQPDLIITTHFGCGHIFDSARKELGHEIPLLYVRNDLGRAFHIQDCNADILFVTSEDAKNDFIRIGVQKDKVKNVNFLVRPQFVENRLTKSEARKKLDIPQDAYTILFTCGGEGLGFGSITEFVDVYLQILKEHHLIARALIVTGRNEELRAALERKYRIPEVMPLGYRDDMHVLTAASDLVGGKFGAIYSMETLTMRKPLIGTILGAPNEYYNKEFVVNNGYGWYAPTPRDFYAVLENLLNDTKIIEETNDKLSRLPLKSGAEVVADTIIQILGP
jgi:UDP-N-acetylglucosamine:LPS N-acetylglucosamine transferase